MMESICEGVPPIPTGSTFTVWDYLVFSITLAISAAIGIYYACTGGKQRTTAEYLLADRRMPAFPVALSIFATFIAAGTSLGTPAEIYMQGTMYWMTVWGAMLTPIFGAVIFGPFFHRMKILSAFEYLEIRYKSKAVRVLGVVIYALRFTLTIGFVMFAPSTAFTEVTGLPVWAAIIATGFVCLFYTTIGGMKAVIWADVFQATIMIVGLLVPIIQGCIETGGILNAWKLTEQSGRVEFFDFNPDPTVRHTFWTLIVGNFFSWLANYSVDQQMIQRYASTKSLKHATIALLVNVPGIFIMITLSSLLGVVIYGYYAPMKCDPLKSGRVTDPNQLAPRFVMDIFQFAPGIPGLYIASLFAGSLSSVSSMLNALATVVWEDIFKLFRPAREASDKTATIATKLLCVVFAGSGMGMAYVFSHVGGTILQMSIAFNGAANAPIVGMFMLGLFFPWANWIGALVGAVLGFAFPMWISIGASVTKPPIYRPMYYDVECCGFIPDNSTSSYFSSTTDVYTNLTTTVPEVSGITRLYMLSYLWNMGLGILITVVVGLIVSFLTGDRKSVV